MTYLDNIHAFLNPSSFCSKPTLITLQQTPGSSAMTGTSDADLPLLLHTPCLNRVLLPTSIEDAFLCGPKTTYAIQAIKKGISQNKIIMIEVDAFRTKYKGHLYYLNPCLNNTFD
jgi:hypothetical protein